MRHRPPPIDIYTVIGAVVVAVVFTALVVAMAWLWEWANT